MSIVFAILAFGLLVFVHELGHFCAAKFSGITVYRFSIGFGPPLLQKKVGDTVYAVRAIPFGGSVLMKGEYDEEEGDPDPAGSYQRAKLRHRFAVSFAGSFMNFVLGILVMLVLLAPVKVVSAPVITGFMDGFEYAGEGGFQPGDRILNINGFTVFVYSDVLNALELGMGRPYDIVVRRGGEKVRLDELPMEKKLVSENDPSVRLFGLTFGREELSFGGRIGYAFKSSASMMQMVVKSVGMLFQGQVGKDDVMGTIGIMGELSSRARQSAGEFWYLVAFLSINLGFVNLLPIPGLDGGRIVFHLIELVRGKPLNPKLEGTVQLVGIVCLFAVFIFINGNDLWRWISGLRGS